MAGEILLAIDCGTQSLRAHLFAADGRLVETAKVPYAPYVSPQPGWAEQDPGVLWDGVRQGCSRLRDSAPHAFARIAGVGVTTQRATMICLDSDGAPLRPAITWLDQRKAEPVWRPGFFFSLALRLAGALDLLHKVQTDSKSNWIAQQQPELWEKTAKYVQVSGYLNHRLTGRFADSAASQIGHLPFNYRKHRWSGPSALNRKLFPIPEEKLPDLVPAGTRLGEVTDRAAAETGLASGTPVIACGSDKGCETIGAGVCSPDTASLSFGTTATVQTTTERYFEPLPFMPPYPAVIPRHYNPEIEIFRGYWMITWYRNELGHPEEEAARDRAVPPEALLDRLLHETPPGAMGLLLQPFWSPGLHHPDAKGAIIGFGDVHTRAHVYRAVIEGLAYALRDGLQQLEQRGKLHARELAVSGGASQSDAICQTSADVFNRPMVRGETCETSGLGLHADIRSAVAAMVRVRDRFTPNAENARLYEQLYQRVYRRMYAALAPLHREIREITGYPES